MTRALTTILRTINEADPIQAGHLVDFEEKEAGPSRYNVTQNIHSVEDQEDELAPYDGTELPPGTGGMPPDMAQGGMPGQAPPEGQLQDMNSVPPPGEDEMMQPGMQESTLREYHPGYPGGYWGGVPPRAFRPPPIGATQMRPQMPVPMPWGGGGGFRPQHFGGGVLPPNVPSPAELQRQYRAAQPPQRYPYQQPQQALDPKLFSMRHYDPETMKPMGASSPSGQLSAPSAKAAATTSIGKVSSEDGPGTPDGGIVRGKPPQKDKPSTNKPKGNPNHPYNKYGDPFSFSGKFNYSKDNPVTKAIDNNVPVLGPLVTGFGAGTLAAGGWLHDRLTGAPTSDPNIKKESVEMDAYDCFLDNLLRIDEAEPTAAELNRQWAASGPATGARSDDVAPRNYAGFSGPQAPPPSVQAQGPSAVRQWQSDMARVGGGAGAARTIPARSVGRNSRSAAPERSGSSATPRSPSHSATAADYRAQRDSRPQSPSANAADAKNAKPIQADAGGGFSLPGLPPGIPAFKSGRAAGLGGAGRAERILGGNAGAARSGGLGGAGRAGQLYQGNAGGAATPPPNTTPAGNAPSRPGQAGVGRGAELRAGNANPTPRTRVPSPGALGRAGNVLGSAGRLVSRAPHWIPKAAGAAAIAGGAALGAADSFFSDNGKTSAATAPSTTPNRATGNLTGKGGVLTKPPPKLESKQQMKEAPSAAELNRQTLGLMAQHGAQNFRPDQYTSPQRTVPTRTAPRRTAPTQTAQTRPTPPTPQRKPTPPPPAASGATTPQVDVGKLIPPHLRATAVVPPASNRMMNRNGPGGAGPGTRDILAARAASDNQQTTTAVPTTLKSRGSTQHLPPTPTARVPPNLANDDRNKLVAQFAPNPEHRNASIDQRLERAPSLATIDTLNARESKNWDLSWTDHLTLNEHYRKR